MTDTVLTRTSWAIDELNVLIDGVSTMDKNIFIIGRAGHTVSYIQFGV